MRSFEGQLVGALERIESGGTVRVIDGLFIRRDPETAELSAIRVGADAARRTRRRSWASAWIPPSAAERPSARSPAGPMRSRRRPPASSP